MAEYDIYIGFHFKFIIIIIFFFPLLSFFSIFSKSPLPRRAPPLSLGRAWVAPLPPPGLEFFQLWLS